MICKGFTFGALITLALLISGEGLRAEEARTPLKIGIIGDSTLCVYPSESPRRGWGQMLPEFLGPEIVFINEGESGKSSKTFPTTTWKKVLSEHPDFVLIQFGHNDENTDISLPDYKNNLRRYVDEAKRNGAIPILVTPMHRRNFRDGKLTTELTPYADAMKDLGGDLGVPVVDLHVKSRVLFEQLGEAGTAEFTVNFGGEKKDKDDRTHFTEKGARELARLVGAALVEIDPRFAGSPKKISTVKPPGKSL